MSDQRTEQPTPRRREKAREQGQIARSRELSSALAVLAAVCVLAWRAGTDALQWRQGFRSLLDSTSDEFRVLGTLQSMATATFMWTFPPMVAAWSIALAGSFAQGGLTWAPATLGLRVDRFNPATRLKQLVSMTALSSMLRSLVPVAAIVYLSWSVLAREWNTLPLASFRERGILVPWLLSLLFEIAWKSSLVVLTWSLADYLFVRYRVEGELKMTREELRREHKESEGDPLVKSRIRRLQRQARRRQMLKDVAKASVVITNPTHYAIALAYMQEMPAPILLAKGRDALAQEIKKIAVWHDVPMVENPPLAHALYRAVKVGETIPSRLYVAVAEVLAFVYRVQADNRNRRKP